MDGKRITLKVSLTKKEKNELLFDLINSKSKIGQRVLEVLKNVKL